ncbi:dipeptidyl aminopeptidase/acylaminoacyl peptidase [Thioalkalivibrio nitratireducens DSM 14787]|uniref:Dipeptidyl aminopeptidase/acylaminoacyl peptidase n=1 Tax=Thioalkalivibrio nitratireducens (strain DSM 14787 / UNIQEM 213 / ALEN2) TaxID=1255043 RepID=L0DZF4_THIND|nr:prolyl oligopeptidase family serine peptidase [Thioalkalivibrio nitratireducens]AGA34969.1 dipeptidyl aminopeptidase/acylaminoacyl peptidase [Thioalkalivibrio nitratireducens DSM 14787]
MGNVERGATRIHGFHSGELDFQLMRVLGACSSGGGSPGEIMAARSRMDDDDPARWPGAFAATADDLMEKADLAMARGHVVSARDHLLRAANYYRSAEYFSDPFGAEAQRLGLASRDAFVAATRHLPFVVKAVDIPFEGADLPGYLVVPPGVSGSNKAVICMTGFDGTAEELYFETAFDAVQRGFTVLIAEGPGQVGTMRRYPDLTFRPDYEVPLRAVVDFALSCREIAPDRLALYGISFGGYFVTRTATYDRRIKALIANAPISDMHAYLSGLASAGFGMDKGGGDLRLEEIDQVPDDIMPTTTKLAFKAVCRRYGVASFSEWMAALEAYRVEDLSRITCPSLALGGAGEGDETLRQIEAFAASVSGSVTTRIFATREGADMHCQMGNYPLSNAVVYDWLDETLEEPSTGTD